MKEKKLNIVKLNRVTLEKNAPELLAINISKISVEKKIKALEARKNELMKSTDELMKKLKWIRMQNQ